MPAVKLYLLGTFQLTIYDQPVNLFRSQRARALLAYLALESARPIARTHLAELLWDQYDLEPGRAYLRVTLSNLRQCLQPFRLLHTTYQTAQFDAGSADFWCDVLELEREARFAPIHKGRLSENGASATPAPTFLESFETVDSAPFQAWLQQQRTRYHQLWSRLSPQRSSHVGGLALSLPAVSPQAGLAPPPTHLVAETAHGAEVEFPAPPVETVDAPGRPASHNLPRRLTSLYGRTAEIEQVCNLLAREDCSLVTLVGEGGIGKTQLALATAEAMLPHFPDGIWLVDLAMLGAASDHIDEGETPTGLTPDGLAGDVAQRLASVVGEALSIRYQSSTNRMERLTAYLRTRRVLLILDGFEEHLDLAPALLTLLRNTAHTKALVTSRRPLNLLAEQRFQVDALALPEPSPLEGVGSLAVERLQHYAAVELFVARAQAIQPQFALTADNATCIVQICQWVGGTPLAIELAAAQLRHSTCAELLAALQQDYQILDTSLADLPERHRNMQRVLESSWRLLTADQARVLAACSIFQRRFSAAAAQAIVETTPQQLFSLVEHSVLRCEDGRRFELHDLVHHFAARHLASNEQAILRERHSRYYLSLLQEHTPGLAADIELFHTLRNEMDNIRAAWAWAVANQQVDLLVQSRQSLFQLYDVTALPQEAVTVVARAAAVVRKLLAEPNTAAKETLQILLAELILDEAHFHGRMARVQMATQLAQEALQLGESLRAPAIQARAAYELSYMLVRSGRRAEGTELARRGLVWARQSAPALEVLCHISLMASAVITSRNLEAVEQGRAALALPQIHAHPRLLAVVYTQLALPLGLTGEVDEAQTLFSQALTIHRQLEDRHHICRTLAYRAIQLFVLGAFAQAEQDLSEAITIADIIDDAFIKIMALSYLGLALTRAERADEGIGSAERAVELGRSLQVNHPMMKVPVTRAQLALGEILVVLGQPQAAYAFLQQGLALASELDAPLDQLKAHSQLAHCDLLTGKPVRACAEAEATLAVLPRIEDNQPFAVPHYLWKAYEVLAAYQHADADPLLRHLYDRIQQNAARIRNPALRRSYLEEVPANRAILALVAKQTATPV